MSENLSSLITNIMASPSRLNARRISTVTDKPITIDTDKLVAGATTISTALEQISELFEYLPDHIPTFTKEAGANYFSTAMENLSKNIDAAPDVLQWAQDTVNNFAYVEAILQGTNPATFSFSQYGISDAKGTMGKFAAGDNTRLGDAASQETEKKTAVGVSATAFQGEGWQALTASAGAGYELGQLGVSASAYAAAALFKYSGEVGFSEYDKWELGVSLGSAETKAACIFSLVDEDGNLMPGIGAEIGASVSAVKLETSTHVGYGGENNNYIGGFVNSELEAGSAAAKAEARVGMDEDNEFCCKLGAEASLIAVKAGLAGGLTVLGTDVGANVEATVGLQAKMEFGYSDGKFEASVGLALLIGVEVGITIDLSDTVDTVKELWGDIGGWCKSTVGKVGDALKTAGNTIKNTVIQAVDKVKSTAQTIAQKTKETATQLYEEAKRLAEEAKRKAEEAKKEAERVAAEAKKKAEEEAKKAKNKITSAAKKVAKFFKNLFS